MGTHPIFESDFDCLTDLRTELSSLTWSQLSLTRPELELTVNFTIPSNRSTQRRTPPTTTPGVTTESARRLWTSSWTGSGSLLTNVLVFKDFCSSTPLEVELDLDFLPFSWSDSPWTTGRSPSWSLPSIPLLRSPPLLLSLTMLS